MRKKSRDPQTASESKRLEEYEFYPFVVDDGGHVEFSAERFVAAVRHFLTTGNPIAARELIVIGEQNLVRDTFPSDDVRTYKELFQTYDGASVIHDNSAYLENYKRIVHLIGQSFPNTGIEILVHDLVNPSKAVIAIEHGEVTGRTLGHGATKLVLDLKTRRYHNQDKLNYELNIGARRFKCTTIPIFRPEYGLVGAICINVDVRFLREEVLTDNQRVHAFFDNLLRTDFELDENILSRSEYQAALQGKRHFLDEAIRAVGGTGTASAQSATLRLIGGLDSVVLSRFKVAGRYTRFDPAIREQLLDARLAIRSGLTSRTGNRENHLVWGRPGTGKTFLIHEIAGELDGVNYVELNLARVGEEDLRAGCTAAIESATPSLVLIDEVDARPDAAWPYETLLPFLDANVEADRHVVFVLAGSSGESAKDLAQAIEKRPKGKDLLSRTPEPNRFAVDPLGVGDQISVAISQFLGEGANVGRPIRRVEKAALYYLASTPYLSNARQLAEFAARAVRRVPEGEERLKYDHLFGAGDPENKEFWVGMNRDAAELVGRYVEVSP
ncbi:MAG: hypothetical protein A2Z12_08135 [Actinobacteria bacterium RBG_16_68_21]|nr:MAG: hypothetical protein A2Z12_08135 [Actinobacteria bacterium RBG_16_68_21]